MSKEVSMMRNKFVHFLFVTLIIQGALRGEEICAIGHIQPSSKSLIGAQVSGRVEKVLVEVGDKVVKNQPLVQLDRNYYEIELALKTAALEGAKVELSDAEKNFLRMQKLWERPDGQLPSISLKKYEEAKSKYDHSLIHVKQFQEDLKRTQLYWEETTIKAPFEGIITKKLVDVGEYITVQPVTSMVEIQALNPLYLEFSIPQVYASTLSVGTPVSFEIDGTHLDYPHAQIDLFYPNLDETTHSLRCRAILDNRDYKIRPGSLARVIIKAGQVANNL
ncbi:hypothetical protein NEOC84_000917|nr:hypothetical protein [Neochlamydia sp. AcF84]